MERETGSAGYDRAMGYSGPWVDVRMVDGERVALRGTAKQVHTLLSTEGPVVVTTDVFGQNVIVNTVQIVRAQEEPAKDFR